MRNVRRIKHRHVRMTGFEHESGWDSTVIKTLFHHKHREISEKYIQAAE